MLREAVFYAVIVGAGTGGELCIARGMKSIGEVKEFGPSALFRVILRVARVGWIWMGVTLMASAFFALLGLLSMENVSMVVPVTALSYAAGTLGGEMFLGEQVSRRRWAGVLLICFGVTLVFMGRQ
jgi:drug/metabolite transporter (DMT)-like permease